MPLRLTLGLGSLTVLLIAGMANGAGDLNLPQPVARAIEGEVEAPVTPPGKVLLIIIDGLRADVAAQLPVLRALAAKGAKAQLWADGPTFSTAQYVALLTGVPPRDSGVRTNATIRAAGLDDIAGRVLARGGTTVALSDEVDWWGRLFPSSFTSAQRVAPTELIPEAGRQLPAASFALIHLVQVDAAGHSTGASSSEYLEAAAAADSAVDTLARSWVGTVVVLADHGHRARGGHGGDEPDVSESFLVAAGPSIRTGAEVSDARSIDVAATLAAILGTSAPTHAQGRTLTELLDVSTDQVAALRAADRARQARVKAATREGRQPLLRSQALGRTVRALLALAGWTALAFAVLGQMRSVFVGSICLCVNVLAFRLLYGPVSFSAARGSGWWVGGALAISFVTAIAGLAWARRNKDGELLTRAAGLVLGASTLAVVAFISEGMLMPRLTCEPGWRAAGPIYAYATLAPSALGASLVGLTQLVRRRLNARR